MHDVLYIMTGVQRSLTFHFTDVWKTWDDYTLLDRNTDLQQVDTHGLKRGKEAVRKAAGCGYRLLRNGARRERYFVASNTNTERDSLTSKPATTETPRF